MSESSRLCVSCGLCCDGTMIGFVKLLSEEFDSIRNLMGIEEIDNKAWFFQPCSSLGCDGCSIYTQRPQLCGEYRCKLLKSFDNKEFDFDFATNKINILKQMKLNLETKMALLDFDFKYNSFYYKILELKKYLLIETNVRSPLQSNLKLLSEINDLDVVLTDNFGISMA